MFHRLRVPMTVPFAPLWDRDAIRYGLIAIGTGILLGLFAVGVTYLPGKWAPLFIVAVLGLCFLMVVQHARWVFLFMLIVDIPLQLDTHLFYREEDASLGAVGGVPVAVTTLSLLGLYALWYAESCSQHPMSPRRWKSMIVPLGIYLGISFFSIFYAIDKTLVLFQFALHFQLFLLFAYIIGRIRSREDVQFIVMALLLTMLLESIIIVALRFIGTTIQVSGIKFLVVETRVAGTVGSPNNAGAYLSLILGPAMTVLFTNMAKPYKWLAGAAVILGLPALVFTLSRGAWIATTTSTVLIMVMAIRQGWLSPKLALRLVLVGVLVIGLLYTIIQSRLTGDDEGSAYTRISLMEVTSRIIRQHPIFGVGANNLAPLTPKYFTPEFGEEAWIYSVHNMYYRIWAEVGIIGLAACLWFISVTLYWGWKAFRRGDAFMSPLAFGFSAAILGHMTHWMFDTFHSRPNVQSLWLNAAIIGVLYMMTNAESESISKTGAEYA